MNQARGSNGRFIKAGGAYIEITANDTKAQQALRNVSNRLQAFGAQAQQIGRSLMTAGVIAGAGLIPVISTLASFKDQISAVAAVSQASEAELAMLEATAKRLGSTTSFTAVQVAAVMTELGRAGFSAQQIDAMTESVLALSRATGTEPAMAAGIMAATLRQFGLEAEDSARAADVLTLAANSTFNTVEGLGESLKYAGPVAKSLGMSFESTVALLGVLGNVGIQGSEAGTALRRLSVISAGAGEDLQRIFGVSNTDASGELKSLVAILDEINSVTANMSVADRTAKMAEAFGLLGITSANVLSETAGGVSQLEKNLEKAGGSAQKTAKNMDDNIGGTIRVMLSALEGDMIALGEALTPVLVPIMQNLTEFLGQLNVWITSNQELLSDVANLVILATQFGAGLYVLGTAAGIASAVISAASVSVTGFAAATGTAAVSTAALSGVIGGLIALTAAAAIGVYNHSEAIKDYNAAMAEAARLNGELTQRQQAQYAATLDQAKGIDDLAEREKFLNEELKRHSQEIEGMQAAVKGAEEEVASLNTTWNAMTGNKLLAEANSELENHKARLKEAQKHYVELAKARNAAEESKNNPQLVKPSQAAIDPQIAADEALRKAEQESFAQSIAEMTKSPLEEFDEFVQKLSDALDRGDITDEQFRRAYGQKEDQTKRALEHENRYEADPLQGFADQINEQMQSPLQRFEQKMADVQKVLDSGLIDEEAAQAYRAQELLALDRELGMGQQTEQAQRRANTAVDANSSEGLSTLLAAAFNPAQSAEQQNGQKLQNISQQMVTSNAALQQIIRELRESQIVKQSKFGGGGTTV